jgi:hypothetical protein
LINNSCILHFIDNMADENWPLKESYITNPLTGKQIRVKGGVYTKLLDSGDIKEITNTQPIDKRTRSDKKKGKPMFDLAPGQKYCCSETKCHLEGIMCCIHGDTRTLILAGKVTYAYRPIYVDGVGKRMTIDYAWRDYCPECVSKSRRDQDVKDIRAVISESEDGSFSSINAVEIQH